LADFKLYLLILTEVDGIHIGWRALLLVLT